MKKLLLAFLAAGTLLSTTAQANLVTYAGPPGEVTGPAVSFTFGGNWIYSYPGDDWRRPMMEDYNTPHTITGSQPFTFNSIDFLHGFSQFVMQPDYPGTPLHMIMLDSANRVLLDESIFIPKRDWFTYSNTVANVRTIYFEPTGSFWPYIDNLRYNDPAAHVPEPATVALIGLGLLGFTASRRKFSKSTNA
jgi:hypothetical protein